MIYGSVCSGIEAATAAWHPLGWQAAWYSEIEDFPSAVLAHHYPDVPNLGDMTKIHETEVFNERPIELLVGGCPCQSFSVAGLRKGLADPRGNLTLHLLKILDLKRPRWLLYENVPGLLSSWSDEEGSFTADEERNDRAGDGGRGTGEQYERGWQSNDFNTFLSGLRELGYGVAWRILDAQFFGVPQRRRRVFVVGYLGDWRPAAAVLFERHSLSGNPPPRREAGKRVAGTLKGGAGERGYPDPSDGNGGGLVDVAGTLSARNKGGGGLGTDMELGGGLIPEVAETLRSGSTNKASHGKLNGTDRMTLVPDVGFALNAHHSGRPDDPTAVTFVPEVMAHGQGNAEIVRDGSPSLTCNHEAPIAFVQNTRDEVRLMGGDGQVVGALSAEPGAKQQCYIATPPEAEVYDMRGNGDGNVVPNLTGDHAGRPTDYTPMVFEARVARNGRGGPSDVVPALKAESGKDGRGDGAPLVAIPINTQLGLRGGETSNTSREGVGIGKDGDPAFTLQAGHGHAVAFKPAHYTRGKDGAPSDIVMPLTADADKGDQDPLVMAPTPVDAVGFTENHRGDVYEHERMGSLTAGGGKPGMSYPAIRQSMQVRRLTPRECERLQGFPDDFTLIPVGKKMSADGPRYKALGNSMAVPVMAWIGKRIQMVDDLLRGRHA